MDDTIYRQAAIDAFCKECYDTDGEICDRDDVCGNVKILKGLPSAQPTLHGYSIDHLVLIANVLQKENLPPERVTEALTNIGRIVEIITDEFVETLRKAVEQCTI